MKRKLVEILDLLLSFSGVRFFSANKFNSKPWLIFQYFNVIIGFLVFMLVSMFVILNNNNIVLQIEGACIWTTGVIMFISLGVCLVFRKEFREFLTEMVFRDGILEMPLARLVLETKGERKLNELRHMIGDSQEKLMKRIRILLKSYVVIVLLCAVLYITDTFYRIHSSQVEKLRILPFNMWLPWSLENVYVYVVCFILNAYGAFQCCISYPGLQTTIILLNGQIIRQYRILSFILVNLEELVFEMVSERHEWQSMCTLILGQCVDQWVKIKRFSEKVNAICKYFYLTLILVAILHVCVCSVKIAISDKISLDTSKYYIHEICFVFMVLMFCYLGQLVINECAYLEEVVLMRWYIYDKRHRVNMKIFHMALSGQRPIYIFGTIPLSLPTFTWFIKTGMSFFTLVMSVLENND